MYGKIITSSSCLLQIMISSTLTTSWNDVMQHSSKSKDIAQLLKALRWWIKRLLPQFKTVVDKATIENFIAVPLGKPISTNFIT